MPKDVEEYFYQRYKKADFKAVPGHWPDFQSQEEVDRWFMMIENALGKIREKNGNK